MRARTTAAALLAAICLGAALPAAAAASAPSPSPRQALLLPDEQPTPRLRAGAGAGARPDGGGREAAAGAGGAAGAAGAVSAGGAVFMGARAACNFVMEQVLSVPDTLNSIALDVSYSNKWEQVVTFPARKPRAFNVLLATTKTWLADLVVQLGAVAKQNLDASRHRGAGDSSAPPVEGFDWRRSAAFACFGCLYVGMAEWFFYVSIFSALCPHAIRFANESFASKVADRAGLHDLARQIVYDNLILTPFVYFPVFYTVKQVIAIFSSQRAAVEEPLKPTSSVPVPVEGLQRLPAAPCEGLQKYQTNFWEDNMASCAIWIAGDFLTYSAPMWLRMPVYHGCGFFWTMGLSYMRGGAPM